MKYYQVLLSAEDRNQAVEIREALLRKKLILGGPIIGEASRFWWKGEVIDMPEYCYILTYTTEKAKERMLEEYKKVSGEEVPMASCILFEGNQELYDLIDKTLNA